MEREVFGPVLHVAPFKARDLVKLVETINASGYGLTAGLHTRIDRRVQEVVDRLEVGNIYVNRNQVGSIVGSQPFGGEKCSGTGPKAGGPHYLMSFRKPPHAHGMAQQRWMVPRWRGLIWSARLPRPRKRKPVGAGRGSPFRARSWTPPSAPLPPSARRSPLPSAIPHEFVLPGPTGESNRMTLHARGVMLCLGPDAETALAQAVQALAFGNSAVIACPDAPDIAALAKRGAPIITLAGRIDPDWLSDLDGFAGVACTGR